MRRQLGTLLACVLPLTCTTSAFADPPERRDVAREIARSGGAYFDEGAWERAREHFHRAYQLVPAPTLALMEARALVSLGRLVEAIAVYDVAATRLVDAGNGAYRRASAVAENEREQVRQLVPTLRIVTPVDGAVTVRIDGAVVSAPALLAPLALDPGTHSIELRRGEHASRWESVTLRERDQRVLQLRLAADERLAALIARQRVAMWSAFIVGAAGATFAVTAAAVASGKHASDGACASSACADMPERDGDPARGWRAASTLGYVVGAAGAATGVWLLATLPRASSSARIGAFMAAGGPAVLVAGAF